MKTVALQHCPQRRLPVVTLEVDEFELVTLVALVEEGRKVMNAGPALGEIQQRMDGVAGEFTTLLGRVEMVAASG